MARKAAVIIEKDEHGFYAWCPELRAAIRKEPHSKRQWQNIKEAVELYLETLPVDEREVLLSREILTTAVEVDA
jgi:predicted RNase H-like HicB family nuclease